MHLSQLKVYLDGQQQSVKPLELNLANNQFINAYASLFMGTGKWMRDEGKEITREDFPGGYALYAFDLTADLAEGGHFNLLKQMDTLSRCACFPESTLNLSILASKLSFSA